MIIALALVFPAIAGLTFLAVDAGRHYNLHTSLQSAADAFALAGAAELDRRPDAITRAERAIGIKSQSLVANDALFGDGGELDISVRFLNQLDAPVDVEPPEARDARFIEVTINPVALSNPTIAKILGLAGEVRTAASATAGFEQAVCEFAPFFICNPFENKAVSLFEAVQSPQWRKRLIALRDPQGDQWFPGNYGFLAAPDGSGASALRDMIAIDRPPLCFTQSEVETEPGAMAGPVRRAINVRFDLYAGDMNNRRSDPRYRPARNVRKGYSGKNCNQQEPGDPDVIRGLPRDDCFETSSCEAINAHSGGRFGDGEWDIDGYWQTNYETDPPDTVNGRPKSQASRYDVYMEELEGFGQLYKHEAGTGSMTEIGEPICYSGPQWAFDDPLDRRMLNAAVVNCIEHDLSGRDRAPAIAFVRLFLTEPVGEDNAIFAELVDIIEPGVPGAETMLRDIVQLYR